MVRLSRFAFDDPRGSELPPWIHPLDDFDDPGCDDAEAAACDPHDLTMDDDEDESPLSGANNHPHSVERGPRRRAA